MEGKEEEQGEEQTKQKQEKVAKNWAGAGRRRKAGSRGKAGLEAGRAGRLEDSLLLPFFIFSPLYLSLPLMGKAGLRLKYHATPA